MARPRVVILGGGFGGLSAAHTLRSEAGEGVDVLLVDRSPTFMMGLRKLWLVDGRSAPGQGTRSRTDLHRAGIAFRKGTVEGMDLERRSVRIDGEDVAFDFLVVALGAEPRADLVPGDLAGTPNLYTAQGAETAGATVRDMDGGRIVIAVAGLPYKCPPAPYEAAFLIEEVLRRTGRRDRFEITVTSPQPMSIPAAGPVACSHVEGRLASKGIRFRSKTTVEAVSPGSLSVTGGEAIAAELVMIVPPHRPPEPVKAAGLTGEAGWVAADPGVLSVEREGVFVIGDLVEMTTGAGLPFPKAGVFAEQHGEVVARNIASIVAGEEPTARFDGQGYCFLETGGGEASMVVGRFLDSPPDVTIADPSPEGLEAKIAFERERLDRWFPSS